MTGTLRGLFPGPAPGGGRAFTDILIFYVLRPVVTLPEAQHRVSLATGEQSSRR